MGIGRASYETLISRRDAFTGGAAFLTGAFLQSETQAQAPRVRMDIVTFAKDASKLATFEAALKEMQDRSRIDPEDPKGWLRNARAHARYCPNDPEDPEQVHYCYWFLAWHRAYIWVTERKIREISGDQSFSYPYWNWSSDRHIPQAFSRTDSPLAQAIRYTPSRGLRNDEVGYRPDDPGLKALGVAALDSRFFIATSPGRIARSFGGIARPNSSGAYGNNALENTPHGPVHVYVGGENAQGDIGDMTDFETAARDPIFFAHHGNLDRLWEKWRRDPTRKGTEPASDAFLNHLFPFIWLDGSIIHVRAGDVLDTTTLGYAYDYLDVFRPEAPIVVAGPQEETSALPSIGAEKLRIPVPAEGVTPEGERKILEIYDIQAPERVMTVGVHLRTTQTPPGELGMSVGSFSAVSSGGHVSWPSQTLSFDITNAARQFAGQEITVDLIPHRIRAEGAQESYPKLKYGGMRIVTEK
jgi:hypothetical protein